MDEYISVLLPRAEDYMESMRADHVEHYANKADIWSDARGDRAAARWLSDRGLQDSERILDIGAGRGRDLELFLKDGHDCTGLDLVEIDTWVDMRKKWGDQVRLESTPFLSFKPEQKYSTIMSIGSLHHQHPNDYGPFLQRVKELLEPGGRFLISVFHIKSEKGPGILPERTRALLAILYHRRPANPSRRRRLRLGRFRLQPRVVLPLCVGARDPPLRITPCNRS